jgi:hypothetical protein
MARKTVLLVWATLGLSAPLLAQQGTSTYWLAFTYTHWCVDEGEKCSAVAQVTRHGEEARAARRLEPWAMDPSDATQAVALRGSRDVVARAP